MAIFYNENDRTYTLTTKNTMYQMKIDSRNVLEHIYYGKKLEYADLSYSAFTGYGTAFSANPPEGEDIWKYSHNHAPQELSLTGIGDFRINALALRNSDGSLAADPRFYDAKVVKGKYSIPGLPAFYGDNAETLVVTLKDKLYDIYFHLYYGVFEEYDLITRSLRVENKTDKSIKLERALSVTLDLPNGRYDLVNFYGRHTRERMLERTPIMHSQTTVASVRGASSHMENPFAIIAEQGANEEYGSVWGLALVYSGNFVITAEMDQLDKTRVVAGINPENFNYEVCPGEEFCTPEVAMVYSAEGFGKMSNCYHKAIRNNLTRGEYKHAVRPVLINNWEATYFDFNADKLVSMARDAAKIGVELFV
ncbi:MAG: alpha-galactosidase, partial [Clostridia bacterium]|nr:alpha-galactosidase [Clostridia bacterium]